MKLFAWAIIGFRKLDNGDVTWGQYLYWSEAADQEALVSIMAYAILEKFPASAGWFETSHNIVEYKGGSQ